MNKSTFISIFVLAIFCIKPELSRSQEIMGKWSGTMSMETISQSQLLGNTTIRVYLTITNNVVTGSVEGSSRTIIEGKEVGNASCTGAGTGELWRVAFSKDGNTYDLQAISPLFTCTKRNLILGTTEIEHVSSGLDLIVDQEPMGANRNVLIGSHTETGGIAGGTSTTTITWNLYSGPIDAYLIIKPIDYERWLPKATQYEFKKGSVMDIELNVQGRNGGNPSFKAVKFELRLNNTSKEPGTTLNMPLNPSADQLPDIRFLALTVGESMHEDQYIEIPCQDGRTGKTTIASYDGGGWTTLTAVAILEGGIRIEGTLFNPNGVKEIPIPKRDPGSHIAKAWLVSNGNPGEKDDKEKKDPNPNMGDGLTAYEEYRGVISKGVFTRLKPKEKELGVMVKRAEGMLFEAGIGWFQNASAVQVIPFDETEIDTDRRLNKNFLTAHVYDQYVLKLEKGATTKNAAGENRPTTLDFMVPRQSELVVINVDWIDQFYPLQEAEARRDGRQMPYTKAELLNSTVAHELAHGVNVNHHGNPSILPQGRTAYDNSNPPYHIFNPSGTEIPVQNWRYDPGLGRRSFNIVGTVGEAGNEESGDLSCFMAYTSLYNWSFRLGADGSLNYYEVPLLPIGRSLCTKKLGVNDLNSRPNSKYFGAAAVGQCLYQIKMRD